MKSIICMFFFFSSRRRHTRLTCDWSSDVCSSDLDRVDEAAEAQHPRQRLGPVADGRVEAAPKLAIADEQLARDGFDVLGAQATRRLGDELVGLAPGRCFEEVPNHLGRREVACKVE